MVADGSGGAQANCGTNFPDGGGIAVLLNKLVNIIHDHLGLVAGSGHTGSSFGKISAIVTRIIAHLNEKRKGFLENFRTKGGEFSEPQHRLV
jgi:hypothetical protein